MGNLCCSEKTSQRQSSKVIHRQKSLTDPFTKKQYEKSLQCILNHALEKFQQNYKIKSLTLQGLIGKGGQASVFQVDVMTEHNDGIVIRKMAMKRVSKKYITKKQVREALLLQKQILTSYPSCFITQIEFACQDESYIYFFMKLAVGGDCFPFVRDSISLAGFADSKQQNDYAKVKAFEKLGEEAIIFILAAVILGLESLHALNVIYRDLKPENILIFQDGYPKLADFGVAAKYQNDDDRYFQMKGTTLYFAPEIVQRRGYDRGIDFWALGVLTYQFTFNQPPFSTSFVNSSSYQQRIKHRLEKNTWPSIKGSKQMRDFINKLLILDPAMRLGYGSWDEIKGHQIFSQIDWDDFENRRISSPLIEIIKDFPIVIKTNTSIDEIIDQQDHGYLPFTFVRNTCDTERKTIQIIPLTFFIDNQTNLKLDQNSKQYLRKK